MRLLPVKSWKLVKFNANGTTEDLMFNEDLRLGERGDFGSPATEYITEVTKEGARVLNWSTVERPVSLQIVKEFIGEQRYLDELKLKILEFCKPNQYRPVELQVLHTNGKHLKIVIRPEEGANFPSGERVSESLTTVISMIAHNPHWYSVDSIEADFRQDTSSLSTSFSFPITFPISFGRSGIPYITNTIEYEGNVLTRPKITINGPYQNAWVTNRASNVNFQLIQPIKASELRVVEYDEINLRWNITDAFGEDKYNDLSYHSNLADFTILPSNLTASNQIIEISIEGRSSSTSAKVEYYERFNGI